MKMTPWRTAVLVCTVPVLLFFACEGPVQLEEQRSAKERLASVVPTDELKQLVHGNTSFATDLYRDLASDGGNLIFSPHSISLALAMTYAGAEGETAHAMATTLHASLPRERFGRAFGSLEAVLGGRGAAARDSSAQSFRLHIVNQVWGQRGHSLLPAYLDTLAENYGTGVKVLDFSTAPEPSRRVINKWVEQQTEHRIVDLLSQGAVTGATQLVLTNAVYFKADWAAPFDPRYTKRGSFRRLGGDHALAQMMSHAATMNFAQVGGVEAIELPYAGNEVSFVAVMPPLEQFAAFEATLSAETLEPIVAALGPESVQLSMPKFAGGTGFSLEAVLTRLGMGAAFGSSADFSAMDGTRSLAISEVVHKAFVAIDEAGTEAAAATAVSMATSAPVTSPRVVTLDHPFIYLVRDRPTGAVLFMGRVVAP
jgi:serpin B